MGGEKEGARDDASGEAGDRSPLQRAEKAKAGAFGLSVERIGLDEKADPNLVEGGIDNTHDESVKDVTDEGAEQVAGQVRGPVQGHAAQQRKEGKRAGEPPEDGIAKTPAHARSIAADIALKEQTEAAADDGGDGKLEHHFNGPGMNLAQAGDEGKEAALQHPIAEDEPAPDTGKAAGEDGAAPAKRRMRVCAEGAANAESKTRGCTQTDQIRGQLGKTVASLRQHMG